MFGGKDKKKDYRGRSDKPRNNANPSPGGINTIDEQTTITGDLEAAGDIRIDGHLRGNLKCLARLIVGPRGTVTGDVVCETALIEGRYTGNIVVNDLLTVKESATVSGSLRARKLAVAAGSTLEGTLSITEAADPAALALPAPAEEQRESEVEQNVPVEA
jgi:cytoskeletal protein CcmA (bactofilin family)